MIRWSLLLLCLLPALPGLAQTADSWNHKPCAIVLTYDDAIDVDLDHVMPALDSLGFKATFYLIGSSPTLQKRMAEWKTATSHGHELGNHSLFHPCDASLPGRGSWITPDRDLSNIGAYSMNGQTGQQMIDLVKAAMQKHMLLVFLFHGVGGGHNINVGSAEHSQLLHFLKDHESEIWIAPMVDVAEYIKSNQKS
jgi:hypothetical protein